MKYTMIRALLGSWLFVGLVGMARAEGAAQVTLTVTQFRAATSLAENTFVDAQTRLAPHEDVTLVNRNGLPTLVAGRGVNLDVTVESADPTESYRVVGVSFVQEADGFGQKSDPDGTINFGQHAVSEGTIAIEDKFLQTGDQGHYEFFVVIQRASDGAIGIIDPGIDNKPQH